ncbi:MAG TPA: hypothetical protein VGK43_03370 [Solirubrobacterales bacterium]
MRVERIKTSFVPKGNSMFYPLFHGPRRLMASISAAGLILGILVLSTSSATAATWTIQTTPNAAGAEHSNLYDISCEGSATKACYSVGKQTTSGGVSSPYAQIWNGTSWTNQTVVTPEGATAGEFQSVDCAPSLVFEKLFCSAAGSYTSGGVTRSLVENSNVSGWALNTTPNPEGASETALKGISCRYLFSTCEAVGYSVKSGKKTAFVIGRNSEAKWLIQTMPEPEGATSSELHGVDCPSSTYCVAVGNYTVSGGSIWAMSATWNGTSWTLRTVSKPAGSIRTVLLDVSCSSSSECAGVGIYRDSTGLQTSFVERWNGTSWSHQASANPVGSTNTVFQGVSCNTGPCVAVGDWNNGKNWLPMAQEYNGSAWALDTTPNPEGATETIIEGVACRSTGCLSSGWYKDSGGKLKTLGETR